MSELAIQHLEWDSSFFNISIGLIDTTKFKNEHELINNLELIKAQYSLIYIICDPSSIEYNNLIRKIGGVLYDVKTTYCQDIALDYHVDENISSLPADFVLNPEIVSLALQSGEYSRFNKDPRIGRQNFENLYNTWISNSINKQIAIETFVYIENNIIIGIITISKKNNRGDIGLLAVDEKHRGKGIGKKLINYALHYFSENGYACVQVVTQKDNIDACKFYKKNNFKIDTILNIYHLWL
jgi:dTDP-4-amino-4,6-dideoxy-D-galactose acyltransferase